MHAGAGKCTCQNACQDSDCLMTLGFSLLSSFSLVMAF